MARKLRIQYEGAIYHVINRGNYRGDVFESAGTAQAFLDALAEATELHGWRLHAYVVMRNHFHLALETPEPNLVEGMHWLQSTFATRFNRLRDERGHLFQGRYQALLVEDAGSLLRVVNYIHLNPARAGIVPAEQLGGFRWSSLRVFLRGPRPAWLRCSDWLHALKLADADSGWRQYLDYLAGLAGDRKEQERQEFGSMCRGWAIGTSGWRRTLAKEHAHLALAVGIAREELQEIKITRYLNLLDRALADARKTSKDIHRSRKGAPWKIAIAAILRREAGAPYAWIASALRMGSASSVRVYVAARGGAASWGQEEGRVSLTSSGPAASRLLRS